VGNHRRRLSSMGTMKRRFSNARCVRCTFLFLLLAFFPSPSFFLFGRVGARFLYSRLCLYSFFPFGFFLLCFVLACSSVAVQECLAFYTRSPCFSRSPLSPPFLNNIWLDVRLIFDHSFCPISCCVSKSVTMICFIFTFILFLFHLNVY